MHEMGVLTIENCILERSCVLLLYKLAKVTQLPAKTIVIIIINNTNVSDCEYYFAGLRCM